MKFKKCMTALTFGAMALGASQVAAEESSVKFEDQFKSQAMFVMGVGLGGEEVGELRYEGGGSSTVTAGGGISLGAGMDITNTEKLYGIELTGVYKFDSAAAENADVSFSRFEFTALPYYQINEQARFGLGVSRHAGVEFSMEMDGRGSSSVEFDPAMALVAQLTFATSDVMNWGVKFTSVEYEANGIKPISGSNASVFLNYRFQNN